MWWKISFILAYLHLCEDMFSLITGQPNTVFLENALKKTTEYFLKFLFLFESIIPTARIMENNNGNNKWSYTIGTIFNHIIDYVQLDFNNGFTNIVL